MLQIVIATWRAGLRSRYVYGVAVLALLLVLVAYLAASFSPRAPRTVALDVGFSAARLSLVLLGLLWIQETLARDIERRAILLSLSYPLGRGQYILGRIVGIMALGALAAVMLGFAITLASIAAGAGYEQQQYLPDLGLPLWMAVFGVWLESLVIIAFAGAVAVISTVPMLPFVLGAGFAVAGRTLGAALEYLLAGGDRSLSPANLPIVQAIQWVVPDLARLDWRLWPMYQTAPTVEALLLAVLSAGAYIALLLSVAVVAFSRREFS